MTDFIKQLQELGFEIETDGDPNETELIVLGQQGAEWARNKFGTGEQAERRPVTETAYYYGWHARDGRLYGVFREYLDTVEQRHGFQRLDSNGDWIEDPTMITEKRELGVRPIDTETAQAFIRERRREPGSDASE
jgi:hypothetical protein